MKSFAAKTRCEKCAPTASLSLIFHLVSSAAWLAAHCAAFFALFCACTTQCGLFIYSMYLFGVFRTGLSEGNVFFTSLKRKRNPLLCTWLSCSSHPAGFTLDKCTSRNLSRLNLVELREIQGKMLTNFRRISHFFSTLVGLSGCFRKILSAIERCRLWDGAHKKSHICFRAAR